MICFQWKQWITAVGLVAVMMSCPATAQIAFGPDFNPSDNGHPSDDLLDPFNVTDIDLVGLYTVDPTFQEPNGNNAAAFSTGVPSPGGEQSAILNVHISNGENGNDFGAEGMSNPDVMNPEPASSVFSAIGNTTGRLESGNVIRFSTWMRSDPNDPIVVAPQIEPIVKLEFWTEARSRAGDFNASDNPSFGDRIFDTDQNGFCLFGDPGEVCATFVDMNGDGLASGGQATPDATLSTTEWTLVSTEYEVDDTNWGYNINGTLVPQTVADVEEIRPVMFLGDWAGTDLTDGGTLLVDNPMLEVYNSAADVPATIPNPEPTGGTTVDGDFNSDGEWDCADIDDLTAAVAGGSTDLSFDMNGDGVLTAADITDAGTGWLAVGGANNPDETGGNPFLVGDATLDGVVDGLDFIEWNGQKFTSNSAWCQGNFNADSVTDGLDFIAWNDNKFMSSDHVSSVPEPAAVCLWLASLSALAIVRKRK